MTTTQDAALTPLWDDKRIAAEAQEVYEYYESRAAERGAVDITRRMRNEYETERQQLRAQLAAQNSELIEAQKYILKLERAVSGAWQPVNDGEYPPGVTVDDAMLAILESDENSEQVWVATFLPDDLRLCRRQAAPTEDTP